MPAPSIGRALLQGFENRHISAICTEVRFVDDTQNHCAHFVNHVLGFDFPLTCGGLLGRPGAAANIRVHETFARCPAVGEFDARPADAPCFAFITKRTAVDLAARTMANIPKKHIGIYCDGEIWHYSNTRDKVVRQRPEAFAKHYTGAGFALFFGTFPEGAHTVAAPPASQAKPSLLGSGLTDDVDVAVWQQFLILRGLLFGKPIRKLLDGEFGPMTEEATEAFQVSAEIPVTGKVDEKTNEAAMVRGFIPRQRARRRTPLAKVTPAVADAAQAVLKRLGPTRVFYTEELVDVGSRSLIARLEPHKHATGPKLRYWHRGVTVYEV
jgi:peptidoglycan hydrolase-like protein with peptidoglycan-binding domain